MAAASPDECEYRFDLVPENEREECFNYELERELTRREGNQPAPAWLKLSKKAKRDYRNRTRIDLFGKREPVTAPTSIKPSSYELVLLPEVLIDWSNSKDKILKSLTKFLKIWLSEQRSFGGKVKRKQASVLLVRLAAWRLAKLSRLSADDIEDKLKPLLEKKKMGLHGNLGLWCNEIESMLS